jgi:hypothetical protein
MFSRWFGFTSVAGIAVLAIALPASSAPQRLDGDQLLARAARLNKMPKSYSVPMHFAVHLHKPIGISLPAKAIAYFAAPDRQALVITSLPRMLTRHISRSYAHLDTVPQRWPNEYRVMSVSDAQNNGQPAYHLDAVPRVAGDVVHAEFDLSKDGLVPLGIEWAFADGSTVRLSVVNQNVGGYMLPAREQLSVSMPRFRLDADGTTGQYALDQDLPDSVFASQ